MGCVSSSRKKFRKALPLDEVLTVDINESTEDFNNTECTHAIETSYSVLHIKYEVARPRTPSSPLSFLSSSFSKAFIKFKKGEAENRANVDFLSVVQCSSTVIVLILRYLGCFDNIILTCRSLYDEVVKVESVINCHLDEAVKAATIEGDMVASLSLEGLGRGSGFAITQDSCYTSPSESDKTEECCWLVLGSPVVAEGTGFDVKIHNVEEFGWLDTPFQSAHDLFKTNQFYLEDVPRNVEKCPRSCSGVVSPAALVELHHEKPRLVSLHVPRVQYPGTLSSVSSFSCLQHLAIGCIGFQPDRTVTDYDIGVIVDTIGSQLLSIRLLKLNGISASSLLMITSNCLQLSVLVVFGCETMRITEKNSNILNALNCDQNIDSLPHAFTSVQISEALNAPRRLRLTLLDVRYSLDLNDLLISEIISSFETIDLFLGSNSSQLALKACNEGRISKSEITEDIWHALLRHLSSSRLVYIDDCSPIEGDYLMFPRFLHCCPEICKETSAVMQSLPTEVIENVFKAVPGSE